VAERENVPSEGDGADSGEDRSPSQKENPSQIENQGLFQIHRFILPPENTNEGSRARRKLRPGCEPPWFSWRLEALTLAQEI
jgi:hypothetical protein